jgi:hypothetical protein
MSGPAIFATASFVGIVATGGDSISRINLWDGSTISHCQGADYIAVYSDLELAPERAATASAPAA